MYSEVIKLWYNHSILWFHDTEEYAAYVNVIAHYDDSSINFLFNLIYLGSVNGFLMGEQGNNQNHSGFR